MLVKSMDEANKNLDNLVVLIWCSCAVLQQSFFSGEWFRNMMVFRTKNENVNPVLFLYSKIWYHDLLWLRRCRQHIGYLFKI